LTRTHTYEELVDTISNNIKNTWNVQQEITSWSTLKKALLSPDLLGLQQEKHDVISSGK
jgi:hypothetical protein